MSRLFLQMAAIEEGRFCREDADCSGKQYCYDVSEQCVDYTQCNRYNRQEAPKRSRHPSQCGPCLAGYRSEELGTGEMALLCKKNSVQENVTEPPNIGNALIIWLIVGGLLLSTMLAILGIFVKRRSSSGNKNKRKQWGELCIVGPTAPPAENSPFIGYSDRAAQETINNNKNLKDKNKLVNATPFNNPHWIRSNPNYEHSLSNDDLSALEQTHSSPQRVGSDDSSNSWAPEQLTIQVASTSLGEYGVEQRDNTMNAVLVQGSYPAVSDATDNNQNNHNPNNNSNGGASSSASGTSDTQDNRERARASNILITQKISMNVNVLNGDC